MAVARPHDHDELARRDAADGGSGHVRVDVRDRDRRAGDEPHPPCRTIAEATCTPADGDDARRHLLVHDVRELRVERRKVVPRREAVGFRPDRLVAGGGGVARLDSRELPHDPVGSLDQALGARVHLGILVEDLQRLGEEPLGRDLAPVPREPRLASTPRDGVDLVRLRLCGMVLPELHPRVRPEAEIGQLAQRRPVRRGRKHRARGEVDAHPDDLLRPDSAQDLGHGVLQSADVVGGVLQSPLRLELDMTMRCRQALADDAVCVLADSGRDLTAVGDVDEDGAAGLGPEVDPECVPAAQGSITTFRPRRSRSAAKASDHSSRA